MKFRYNQEKNAKLIKERGIGFNEIIQLIENGNLVRITDHHNMQDYSNQKILHVKVLEQIYLVPYITEQNNTIFLKTLYPSRKATKEYFIKKL